MDNRILKVESISSTNSYFLKSDLSYNHKLKKKRKYSDEEKEIINENETLSFDEILKRRKT